MAIAVIGGRPQGRLLPLCILKNLKHLWGMEDVALGMLIHKAPPIFFRQGANNLNIQGIPPRA